MSLLASVRASEGAVPPSEAQGNGRDGSTASVPRSRLLRWLDEDRPLAILHAPAGTGKSELLTHWVTSRADRRFIHVKAPIAAHQLTALLRDVPATTDGTHPTLVIDEVDSDLPADVERMLFASVRNHPELRVVVAGRSTRGLEARAQRARVRSTIRFGEDLAATIPELAEIIEAGGRSPGVRDSHELFNLAGGWMEPTRLILEESPADSFELGAAMRWMANVALGDVTGDDLSLMDRLSLLDRIDSDTIALAAPTKALKDSLHLRVASLEDKGLLRRSEERGWVIVPIVRSVVEARIRSMPTAEAQALHMEIAQEAFAFEPRRFAREVLRHARSGHAWELLERFWSEHSATAMAEHPRETRAAFAGVPEHVLNRSTTLAVAAALSTETSADDGALERLARYSDQHRLEAFDVDQGDSTDFFVEATVIRILQLRRVGRLTDAHDLSGHAEQELSRRVGDGAGRPTAANSALLLIQQAVNRVLTHYEGASAADLARRALYYARASKLDSLTSNVLGYLAALRAANGWSSQTKITHALAGTALHSTKSIDSSGPGHDVAVAMAGVDRLDREQVDIALDRADSQWGIREIWPLAALAQSRRFLLFENSDVLDDHYRRLLWSHPDAHDEPGTGRMILDWAGVLADLRAGRLAEAEGRIAESKDESSQMSVLEARLHLSKLDHEAVLNVIHSALSDGIGNRERSQFFFMGAASSLMLGKEHEATTLFQRARSVADTHGLRSTYLIISHEQRAELLALTGDELPRDTAVRLDDLPVPFPEQSPTITLSAREMQALHGIATGASHRQIASALYISVPTVRSHIRTLYGKLAVGDSVTAMGRARELGLLLLGADSSNVGSSHANSSGADNFRADSSRADSSRADSSDADGRGVMKPALPVSDVNWNWIRSLTGTIPSGT